MMKKIAFLGILGVLFAQFSFAQNIANGKIKIYFNTPVNTAVSSGVNAVYLNKSIDDTLIAYINRAKYSMDIAVYDYSQSSNFSDIATAINNAYSRGVKVRWIYDSTEANTGLTNVNAAIIKLPAKSSAFSGIMHNKFVVFDAKSTNLNDPIVWTGSTNWKEDQINEDPNNVVIVQDKTFAQAYLTEFNEMWGDTGLIPNTTVSKFGSQKTRNTQTQFTIGGVSLELYFSPTDSTTENIIRNLKQADYSTHFGIYTFTDTAISNVLANNYTTKAVNTFGIMDYNCTISPNNKPYLALSPLLGNKMTVYNVFGKLYHSKLMIIDVNSTSNPTVVTGSHNWTKSANSRNDENTIIFHDATIANVYYQSFWQNFEDIADATILAIDDIANAAFVCYPNPIKSDIVFIKSDNKIEEVKLFTVEGRELPIAFNQGLNSINLPNNLASGFYFLKINGKFVQPILKE